MAGFQQAANAIVGAYGTVAGKVGIYNELVGKNKELIKKTQAQNEELTKKNEELKKKNDELEKSDKIINLQDEIMKLSKESNLEQDRQIGNLTERMYSNLRARASRDIMLDYIYGENPKESPDRKYYKELLKQEREEGGK